MVPSIIPQREIVEELGTFKLVHGIPLLGIQATAELRDGLVSMSLHPFAEENQHLLYAFRALPIES